MSLLLSIVKSGILVLLSCIETLGIGGRTDVPRELIEVSPGSRDVVHSPLIPPWPCCCGLAKCFLSVTLMDFASFAYI